MRVLLWSSAFWPHVGGVEVLGANFVEGLSRRGHDVLVVADLDEPGLAAEDVVANVPVRRVAVRKPLSAGDARGVLAARSEMSRIRADFAPDLDHVFFFGPELPLLRRVLGARRGPFVVSLHLGLNDAISSPHSATGATLREAGWVVACSEAVLRDTRARIPGLDRSSAIVNALPAASDEPVRAPAGSLVLMLGRLSPQKGFDLGLRAFAALAGRHPSARFAIAGDGAERAPLEQLADQLGVSDRVEFHGWVAPPEVPALLDRSVVVLMPSRFEPYGLVALEAARRGRPVIAADVDGLREAVVDGVTGVLVPPGDVDALGAALDRLLADPGLAERLGAAGAERHGGMREWERHLDLYEEVYRRAVALPESTGGPESPRT
jgi:glycosyltransferase involved in cell wall biosynthesis